MDLVFSAELFSQPTINPMSRAAVVYVQDTVLES